MKIIWCIIPEISGATNRIFCHFGPFSDLWLSWQFNISKFWKNEKKAWRYHDFTLKYHKWRSYDLWFLTYRAGQTFLLPFSAIFCLYPTNNLKNQNFEKTKKCFEISFLPHWQPWKWKLWKNKKKPRDIIILHMCTKAYDQMKYGSWDMVHGGRTDRLTDRKRSVPHLCHN